MHVTWGTYMYSHACHMGYVHVLTCMSHGVRTCTHMHVTWGTYMYSHACHMGYVHVLTCMSHGVRTCTHMHVTWGTYMYSHACHMGYVHVLTCMSHGVRICTRMSHGVRICMSHGDIHVLTCMSHGHTSHAYHMGTYISHACHMRATWTCIIMYMHDRSSKTHLLGLMPLLLHELVLPCLQLLHLILIAGHLTCQTSSLHQKHSRGSHHVTHIILTTHIHTHRVHIYIH